MLSIVRIQDALNVPDMDSWRKDPAVPYIHLHGREIDNAVRHNSLKISGCLSFAVKYIFLVFVERLAKSHF